MAGPSLIVERLLLEICQNFLPSQVPGRDVLLHSLKHMTALLLMHDNIAFFLSDKALCCFNEEFGIFHNTDLFWG